MSDLLRSFVFHVSLTKSGNPPPSDPTETDLGDGGFQECQGLEIDQDVQEYYEGGNNNAVIRRVGRAKYQNLVLKRGMFFSGDDEPAVNTDLWDWLDQIVSGTRPVTRYDGEIAVYPYGYNDDAEPVARWKFTRGLPAKIVGPQLNAKTGEVAIEELHIAHEGLRLVGPED